MTVTIWQIEAKYLSAAFICSAGPEHLPISKIFDFTWFEMCLTIYICCQWNGGVCVFVCNTMFEVRKGNTASLESEIPQIYSWSHNPAGFGLVIMMMMLLLAYLCGYSFLTVYLCKWDFLTGAPTQRFPHSGVRWKIQRGALFSWSQYLFKQKPSLIIMFGFLSFGKWLIL